MPDGRTHYRYWRGWRCSAIVIATLAWGIHGGLLDKSLLFFLAFPLGYQLGAWIDPDLDLRGNTRAKRRYRRSILYPAYWWWQLYSIIASKFAGHRSLLTHLPLLSTAIRLAWVLIPIIVITAIMGWFIPEGYVSGLALFGMGLLLGLSYADTIHVVADIFMRS